MCVCLGWNRIVALDPDSLTATASRDFVGEPAAAVPFGANHLLTAIGAELLVIDGSSLATIGSLPRAVDFDRIDGIAASPSGTHIAVARRSGVRILRTE
ncbi:MAG: hypothetical protein MUC36_12335 [Planctomycetes bacterium]|nr:hypothetical protein [Planctomycetota bacterium]